MTPEQKAAYIYAQAIAALCEREAMKAENLLREQQGRSPAYGQHDFMGLINKYGISHNAIIDTFGAEE